MHAESIVTIAFSIFVLSPSSALSQSTSLPASAPLPPPVCSNYGELMRSAGFPVEAIAQNLKEGKVVVEFTITADDRVVNVRAIESSHPVFAAHAVGVVSKYQCKSYGKDVVLRVPFGYRTEN